MAFAWFALRHALILLAIAATVWAAGRLCIRLLRLGGHDVPAAIAFACGFAVCSQVALLLGLGGWLRTPVLAAVNVAVHVAALPDWRRALAALASCRRAALWRTGVIVVCAAPFFLVALYPPLGFDQTLYHLPAARAFAVTGGVPFLPALRYPIFPQLAEVLNAVVLLCAGDVATQLVSWTAMAAAVALVCVWARELSSPAGGWVAAATLAGSPIAFYLASTGYVEPMLSLLALAALYTAARGSTERHMGWVVASGIMAGSAAGTKYLGLYFLPAAAALLVSTDDWRLTLRRLSVFGVAALAALAPSYGRLIAHTGNPLFPFYPELFGSSPWAAQEFLGARGVERLTGAATLLWDVAFRRQLVGAMPPFSPAFAFALPIVLVAAWRRPLWLRLLGIAAGYILLAPVHAHYVLGIAPLWAVLFGASIASLVPAREPARRAVLALAVVLFSGGEAYAAYRLRHLGLPPTSPAARAELIAAERPMYPAVAFLNRAAGPVVVYGIGAENLVAYANGTLLGDQNGPASFSRIEARVAALGSLAPALDEIGAAYLLLPAKPSMWLTWAISDVRLARVYADGQAVVFRVTP